MAASTSTVVPAPAPTVDAAALLKTAPARTPYVLGGTPEPFANGVVARGVHTSQVDAEGAPLALLVFEPRGARSQMIPLGVVAYAIASGLITDHEIKALRAAHAA